MIDNDFEVQNYSAMDEQEVKDVLASDDRLASAVVLFFEEELIVGVRAKTFSRFHKTKIEKDIKKQLKEKYPDLTITVSADSKIKMETKKLIVKEDQEKLDIGIKKIKSLLKEET
ncbi:hypothetical protein [Filibacter tadaridae]|uniref:hypothetical protein n=1 Tax=Filibacter tadaridae TaxID=2483811 RepID=UPI0039EC5C1F